jgi:hypothetical protein
MTEEEQVPEEDEQKTVEQTNREKALVGDPNHGLSFRMEQGGDMYAPSRDFAHNYPQMIQTVIECFKHNYWPELWDSYLLAYCLANDEPMQLEGLEADRLADAAFDELEQAKDTYCAFINEACADKAQGCTDALGEVGWGDVPVPAQVTWLAMLGQVLTGQLFQGIRDLQREPGDKPAEVEELLAAGHDARRFMNNIDAGEEKRADVELAVRNAVRVARASGMSFVDIEELVADVKLGRVANDS